MQGQWPIQSNHSNQRHSLQERLKCPIFFLGGGETENLGKNWAPILAGMGSEKQLWTLRRVTLLCPLQPASRFVCTCENDVWGMMLMGYRGCIAQYQHTSHWPRHAKQLCLESKLSSEPQKIFHWKELSVLIMTLRLVELIETWKFYSTGTFRLTNVFHHPKAQIWNYPVSKVLKSSFQEIKIFFYKEVCLILLLSWMNCFTIENRIC